MLSKSFKTKEGETDLHFADLSDYELHYALYYCHDDKTDNDIYLENDNYLSDDEYKSILTKQAYQMRKALI